MELHMHSHHLERRVPDWRAAVVAGVVAGVIFLMMEVAAAMVLGSSPLAAMHMTAGIVMGHNVVSAAPTFTPSVLTVAVGVHFVLSIAFGLILAAIMAPFSLDSSVGMAAAAGLVFGAVLYAFDFHVMTMAFPWFAAARGQTSLATHLVFGLVAALSYLLLERREKAVRNAST
ncbi:hypothetical protein [Cupriavidus pinatubonensis]|uniref:hypothetical protein n=1 Tax=Cupriavidus pinatubonensis TaxID=248026 RepID=UPI0011263CDB|nr:hypothetical protein [Cupriavidus pinatubonensis]TPQ31740.1 hypothetical protein C2U69_28205 [Cupriavidus pinatubonensis]